MTVVNTAPPVISGTAQQGNLLSTTDGTWTFDDDYLTFAYRWLRCDAAGINCNGIPGETGAALLLRAADVGFRIRSEVTATEVATPPPGGDPLPSVITVGGTYSGTANGSGSTPAVRIATADPVIIQDSAITNSGGGLLISSPDGIAAQLIIRRTTFTGVVGGYGRAVQAEGFKSIRIENCTIVRTGGIDIRNSVASGSMYVGKNKCRNIQGSYPTPSVLRQFCQMNGMTNVAAPVVEWNEIINEFGQGRVEDSISMYGGTSHVEVKNNYIDGGYPFPNIGDTHSGMGIIVGDFGGTGNTVHDNQVVAYTNGGIAIAGGNNNRIYDNRIISDGKTDGGTPIPRANIGFYIASDGDPGFANNTADGNIVGFMHYGSPMYRNDWWTPDAANDVDAENTHFNGSATITRADETAEWTTWQAKVAGAGVVIGA